VKSGPDVFADALVPQAGADARRSGFPNPVEHLTAVRWRGRFLFELLAGRSIARHLVGGTRCPMNGLQRAIPYSEASMIIRAAATYLVFAEYDASSAARPGHDVLRCANGYRFAKRQGKPNFSNE
jgi:hypothetical protein